MAEAKLCAVEGCDKRVFARALCSAHYRNANFRPGCVVTGCSAKAHARGLCLKHWKRERRNGDCESVRRQANGRYLEWFSDNRLHVGSECLLWPFARQADGRAATIKTPCGQMSAARWMCTLAYGEPPNPEAHAAHSCGNGHLGCLNPKHLRWATKKENAEDMIIHGRSLRGTRSPNAKTNAETVLLIKADAAAGLGPAEIARVRQVPYSVVQSIRHGRTWRWLKA